VVLRVTFEVSGLMLWKESLVLIMLNVTIHSITVNIDFQVGGTFMMTFDTREVGLNDISLESSSSSGA
jgi:hypothetical protein